MKKKIFNIFALTTICLGSGIEAMSWFKKPDEQAKNQTPKKPQSQTPPSKEKIEEKNISPEEKARNKAIEEKKKAQDQAAAGYGTSEQQKEYRQALQNLPQGIKEARWTQDWATNKAQNRLTIMKLKNFVGLATAQDLENAQKEFDREQQKLNRISQYEQEILKEKNIVPPHTDERLGFHQRRGAEWDEKDAQAKFQNRLETEEKYKEARIIERENARNKVIEEKRRSQEKEHKQAAAGYGTPEQQAEYKKALENLPRGVKEARWTQELATREAQNHLNMIQAKKLFGLATAQDLENAQKEFAIEREKLNKISQYEQEILKERNIVDPQTNEKLGLHQRMGATWDERNEKRKFQDNIIKQKKAR